MTNGVFPRQIVSEPLVRVKPESKEPVIDNNTPEPPEKVAQWVAAGGNAGICLRETDTVVVDLDNAETLAVADALLPETFEVQTGSGWVHRYYSCTEWERNTSFSGSSIRSDGWMAVVPPSHHPNGSKYQVAQDCEVAEVEPSALDELLNKFVQDNSVRSHPEPKPRGTGGLDELDELIDHDGYRSEVREVLEDRDADHERRVWLVGFLSEAVGLSVGEIVHLIDRHNRWSNYDQETTERQVKSVVESAGGGG